MYAPAGTQGVCPALHTVCVECFRTLPHPLLRPNGCEQDRNRAAEVSTFGPIQPAPIVAPILVASAQPRDKRRLMRCFIPVTDGKGDPADAPHPFHAGGMLEVELAQQTVPLEVPILLFDRRTLALHRHGTGAVVFVTGHRQGRLGAAERRQTHGRHSRGVLPQRGLDRKSVV